jgi:hypothetical protein
MRFVVELTDGVTSQVGLSGVQSSDTSFTQGLTQVKDILQANGIDVGMHFFTIQLANRSGMATAKLFLETSMQNEDANPDLWEVVGDPNGLDLYSVSPAGTPKQLLFSITEDLGRYLRWRIVLQASGAGDPR